MKISNNFNKGAAPDIKSRTFSFKKKEWPDEENIQKMKIAEPNGGAEYSDKFRILSGKEHPELFLLWLRAYRTKVWNNQTVTYRRKLSILQTLCKEEALSVLNRTVAKTDGIIDLNQIPMPHTYEFKNIPIVNKLRTFGPQAWQAYIIDDTTNGFAADQITECIHALKFKIYGNDSFGRNICTKLKRQMRITKVNYTDGIRKWANRMEDYQTYLPDLLWESGEADGLPLIKFNKMDMRELLESALSKVHKSYLQRLGNC